MRFGNSGTFYYAPGDTLTSGTYLYLDASQMPQYPFESECITDRVTYRTKSGKSWSYSNYNLQRYTFNWSLLDSTCKNNLKAMYDANPILTFNSNGTLWGTFRLADDTWKDSEASFDLFDVAISIEETT